MYGIVPRTLIPAFQTLDFTSSSSMAPAKKGGDHDDASPGKIFVGGLSKDTTKEQFYKYFAEFGDIVDHVIMEERFTHRPRGFGFVTYEDPADVGKVMAKTHVINDKQVEIKRTIPKGSAPSKDIKTKKIFVGGIPSSVTEEELKSFFTKYGKVVDQEILLDHATKRSRGFGFVVFDSEHVVDGLLSKGNMIDFAGSQVEIKKAEPKRASNPRGSTFGSESRPRQIGDGFGRYASSYNGYGVGGYGPSSYRTPAALAPRPGDYDSYVGSGYAGPSTVLGGYRGETSLSYPDRLAPYAGGYGGGLGGFARDERFGPYVGSGYGFGSDSGPAAGYGSGGLYGRGGGYGGGPGAGAGVGAGGGRYHPYAR